MKRKIHAVVDLQFGSTGKGLIAGWLAEKFAPDTVVTAWAPNAGHTYITSGGHKMIHTMLANGCVSPKLKRIMIGPGSVINVENLHKEIDEACAVGLLKGVQICVHEHAAVVGEKHREAERLKIDKIGSTQKGSGAALVSKIMRDPNDQAVAKQFKSELTLLQHNGCKVNVVEVDEYNYQLDKSKQVLIEGAQGFSLGINNGFYPYTTSRECTIAQLFNDCAIPIGWLEDTHVVGSCRTFPIRVANRIDNEGNEVSSGPCYSDQKEISFEDIGQQPELTTVTQLPRRVFTFSHAQIYQAIRMNRVDTVFLNFANYLVDKPGGKNAIPDGRRLLGNIIDSINEYGRLTHSRTQVGFIGWGPTFHDVEDL